MSIDLDSFPLPLYEKDREGPEPNRRTETEAFRLTLVWLALEPWAGRPGLSLLFCSRHEKDARKRYGMPSAWSIR